MDGIERLIKFVTACDWLPGVRHSPWRLRHWLSSSAATTRRRHRLQHHDDPPRVPGIDDAASGDFPASAQACVAGVGVTHAHPSWRNFAAIPLVAAPPNRYEFAFNDVPIDTRVSFRVNDQNFCDENPTGAVTRNVFVNDVRVIQNTLTPGNGDEPGFAITVSARGTVSQ